MEHDYSMTQNNSKHLIKMSFGNYDLYIKDYKISQAAKVSEISSFNNKKQFCYSGFEHSRVKVTALIEKSKFNHLVAVFKSFMGSTPYSVTIDEVFIGSYIITEYEISGSEDDYLYKVSLSLCNA